MSAEKAEREHSLLSASASHRWLPCTPSARLEETLPDSESEAAKKGSLAHSIGELKLRKFFLDPMGPKAFNNRLKKLQADPLYEDEMLSATDIYLEYVQGLVHGFSSPPYVAIEKRLDYSPWTAPNQFGTGDCVVIGGRTLIINDFKYGKGVSVSAKGNPQMRLYALGAYSAYSILYPIETVKMAIIQPRLDDISEDEISISDLLEWGESIKPIAAQAFAGEGQYVPGEHCKFCRAKATCRARTEQLLSLESYHTMKPPLISNSEVGEILERAQTLASWVSAIEDFALAELLKGGEIPGWKAVHGRGSRQYVDIEAAFAHLKANGIDEAVLYDRKPLTVPAVEKVIKAKSYKELLVDAGHVRSEPGKPTIAPITDTRPPFTNQVRPEDVFAAPVGGTEE